MFSQEGAFSMTVYSHGKLLREFPRPEGLVISGPAGKDLRITVHNTSAKRVLCVITLDGLNIVEGRESNGRDYGFILEPGSKETIGTWFLSADRHPGLQFGKFPEGPPDMMDEPTAPGELKACFFNEQENPVYTDDYFAQMVYSLRDAKESGWGESSERKVVLEQFAAEATPVACLTLWYSYKSEDELGE